MPLLKSCVCGCSLETGVKVIGSVGIITSFLVFIISHSVLIYDDDQDDVKGLTKSSNFVLKFVEFLVALTVNILIVVGTYQKRKSFFVAWLAFEIFVVIFCTISSVFLLITWITVSRLNARTQISLIINLFVIFSGVCKYLS